MEKQEIESYESFESMNISENLLRGIYAYGYENPSKIQQKAIVPIKEGVDLIAQSQSGTGKTGTFVFFKSEMSPIFTSSLGPLGPSGVIPMILLSSICFNISFKEDTLFFLADPDIV